MSDKEQKQLEKDFDKAIEAINAFNKAMNEGIDSIKDYIGVAK